MPPKCGTAHSARSFHRLCLFHEGSDVMLFNRARKELRSVLVLPQGADLTAARSFHHPRLSSAAISPTPLPHLSMQARRNLPFTNSKFFSSCHGVIVATITTKSHTKVRDWTRASKATRQTTSACTVGFPCSSAGVRTWVEPGSSPSPILLAWNMFLSKI